MKKFLVPFILLISMFVSCADDNDKIIENPIQEGDEIMFGAQLSEESKSRTEYGEYTAHGNFGFFPVNWVNTDQIAIYCPQASNPTVKHAKYEIQAASPASNVALGVTRMGDCGLQWGSEDVHEFYGIYPASLVPDAPLSGFEFEATLPASQSPDKDTPRITDKDGNVTLMPNMDYAIMSAYNTIRKSEVVLKNQVNLSFKPLVSVLDISVSAPANSAVRISSIRITASKINSKGVVEPVSITGAFKVHMDQSNHGVECTVLDKSKVANIITLNMPKGELYLESGKQLNAKAFLIPDHEQLENCQFEISVNMAQGTNTKTFTEKQIIVEPHKVFRVKLPTISEKVTPEYWMTKLDPNIYLTELSVPGSKMSVLTETNKAEIPLQTVSIADQYKAGVRAFILQTHVIPDLDKNQYKLYVCCNNQSVQLLQDALLEIAGYLESSAKNGKREYAFVMITYDGTGFRRVGLDRTKDAPGGLNEYDRWINTLQKEINHIKKDKSYRIFNGPVTSNTVLGDVANQIVLKVNTNEIPPEDIAQSIRPGYNLSKPAPLLFSLWKSPYESAYPYGVALGWGKPVGHAAETELKWLYQEVTTVGYEVKTLDLKKQYMTTVFDQSLIQYHSNDKHDIWFMNDLGGYYYSATLNPHSDRSAAEGLAIDMNNAARDYLAKRPDDANASLGLVFMNFADRKINSGADEKIQSDFLIQTIIDNNFKFGLRKKAGSKSYSAASRTVNTNPDAWDE